MFDKLTEPRSIAYIGNISSIISLLITIIGLTITISNFEILPQINAILLWMPYVAIALAIVAAAVFWYDNRRLRRNVHDGMKFTRNDVTISVDIKKQIYYLSFEKHFETISDNESKWYKAQFYCNRYLEDSEHTRQFYAENTPKWEDLNVFANMMYRGPKDADFCTPIRLKVVPITDNSYYIPFHIHYESIDDDGGSIALEKRTKVILNYGYQVSARLWGSYLNRSLSFFGERSHVTLQYPNINIPNIEVSLHRLSPHDSSPQRIRKCKVTSLKDNKVTYYIELPSKSSAKFRIWWDSQALLDIPSANNVVDDSKMTDY